MDNITKDVAVYCACMKLRVASRKVTRLYDDALRPAGITPTQFTLLSVVDSSDTVTLTKLAEVLGLERTTLLRNLRPLKRDGIIKLSDEGYRRARTVVLSSKGSFVLKEALPLWREAQATLKQLLGPDVWDQIQVDLTMVDKLT